MSIKIVDPKPDLSVVEEVICKNCGVKLSFVPNDIETKLYTFMGESNGGIKYITCPNCNKFVVLKEWS